MKFKHLAAAVLCANIAIGAVAQAQSQSGPVAANAFITFGVLDWAWASPCQLGGNGCAGTFVLADGFRFATLQEWAGRPNASAFLDPSGNYAVSLGNMRCASPWFNISPAYTHCDYGDVASGYVSSGPGIEDANRLVPSSGLDETWLVRSSNVVPEPSTVALLGTGLALAAFAARRRKIG